VKLLNQDKADWSKAKFMVFDAPMMKDKPFEDRLAWLYNIQLEICIREPLLTPSKTITDNQFIEIVKQVKCEGQDHLKTFLDDILKRGGEGVVLRKPNAVYMEPMLTYKVC
jgi:DNA ligase-1